MTAMTGPQWYPGADTTGATRFDDNYPGDRQEVNVIVWHSTEGTSLPGYDGGATAPTITAVPDFKAKRLKWVQHYPFDMSARALVNKLGGVETNTNNVAQVEIVGTSDPATHKRWGSKPHLYMPELPDWAVRDLAAFAKWAHDNHGVPLTSGVTFKAYPGSYGASNGVRMSGTKWNAYKGHCGHQHVPENLHGDPGNFPMAEILKLASAGAKPPTKPAPSKPSKPTVSLKAVADAARRDPALPQGKGVHPNPVKIVETALVELGYLDRKWADGAFGTKTREAYSRLQRHLGYSGRAADGVPGEHSLKWLALKTQNFTVVA